MTHYLDINFRGVAQMASAPALGAGGPQFKSGRPDQTLGLAKK